MTDLLPEDSGLGGIENERFVQGVCGGVDGEREVEYEGKVESGG